MHPFLIFFNLDRPDHPGISAGLSGIDLPCLETGIIKKKSS